MTEKDYINYLLEQEVQAIIDYRNGIKLYTTNNKELKRVFLHILIEEEEHWKMLNNYLKEGDNE